MYVASPFVIESGGQLTGFSADLWREIAARMKVQSVYQIARDPDAGLAALSTGQADLAASGATMTSARNSRFDFSAPILDAGQQVMVREGGARPPNPLIDLPRLLFSSTSAGLLGLILLAILIPAHVVWLIDGSRKGGEPTSESYIPGLFRAARRTAGEALGQGEPPAHPGLARAIAVFWALIAVGVVAIYTAQLTSMLTVQQLQGDIAGPDDLPGRQVATIAGSVSANYLGSHNARVAAYATPAEMYRALLDKKVDAVLFSAPVLQYYAAHDGKGLVKMVGPDFDRLDMGIAFPNNSPLRKAVDAALLSMKEDGTYRRIYTTWFSGPG
jgi:polar amino acid transport system substrate-binding protein